MRTTCRRVPEKNRFWDDCGTWDSNPGHTVKSHYVCRDGDVTYVRQVSGNFCVRRTENGKRLWRPLSPQPESANVVCVCSYYTCLKRAPAYRKRAVAAPEIYSCRGTTGALQSLTGHTS